MESRNYVSNLECHENKAISRFKQNEILRNLSQLDEATFRKLLLQKRLFSLEFFERFYNTAICALDDGEAKRIGRGLILEEYATRGPTHREDTVYDLAKVGIPKLETLTTPVSDGTLEAIDATIDLVKYDGRRDYDIRAVTALRVGGEVFAGVEMELIYGELGQRYGLTKSDSRFYWPHAKNDKKTVPLGEAGSSHSDKFGQVLIRIVGNEEELGTAKGMIDKAYTARSIFYNQFK